MEFSISPVKTEDVDLLVRKVEFPAHQDNPLYRIMFPRSIEHQWEQREDEIRWMIDGLLEAVHQDDESLYKVCGVNGLPVGLIGWTTSPGAFAKGINGGDCSQTNLTNKSASEQGTREQNQNSWVPPNLDVLSWLSISKKLREERQRVLRSCPSKGICRKSAANLNDLRPC
ncbi:hypothetical protein L228DRAFT_246589 [Xylona heveae TC161]|uniref:N-acetyltransferase domain-containing protein n=1 Tax=Xylona heveae (strain CBS 132557 / TC161) TaxID=1328760 RepID=A0A165HMR0_XYLHT|nr:hypothetical protein L228DRAFT_246589 [Xylona heveae TC161]KZF23744.1 hypothetical protein L228DRAFT_246589 [Xylona heveae TC161]